MKNIFAVIIIIFLAACSAEKQTDIKQKDVLQYVDPFIGTGFHGHTFPGAVVPHGRIQLSPDTHIMGWDASSGYHYDDTTLYGFSHTHLSGTGIGDLGDILFLPFIGDIPKEKPVGGFSHNTEKASPGYYKVSVEPWNIQAELTATKRTGYHRYTFSKNTQPNIMIDLSHVLQPNWGHRLIEGSMNIINEYTVEGYRLTSGWAAFDPVYFKCVFNQPITNHDIYSDGNKADGKKASGKEVIGYFQFENTGTPLEAKVSISSVDANGASINLSELDGYRSFDAVRKAAEETWQNELSKIEIESEDKEVLVNFYTALYHTKIAPILFTDADDRYLGMDQQIHQSKGIERYSAYSLWDTFRSWFPLMTIIEPERSKTWSLDLYNQFSEGGILPKWPLNGNYTGTMVGYPANAILADAFKKGILDTMQNEVLDAVVTSSSWQQDFYDTHKGTRAEGVMPMHIYYKEKLGFVPIDQCRESVSYGLEMAYYDWCVAQIADIGGDVKIKNEYLEKGKAYKKYFDKDLNFMRGIQSDGSRDPNFNPRYSNHQQSEFVEGNSYQWTPFVPHDPEGLADLMGGKESFGIWLDSLFTTSSEMVGDNVSGDITGLIGQYAHGNEPSHHIPYLYQYTDRPWKAQEVIDTILYHFYKPTPDGIIGNEDCGQMSAWFVLNALGIYQLAPGNPDFLIGRPLIDQGKIKIKDGWFEIKVINNSKNNKYVKEVKLNGIPLNDKRFDYIDIKSGNSLEITMTSILPMQ